MTIVNADKVAAIGSLEELKSTFAPLSMMAGWNKVTPSLWPARPSDFKPYAWSWDIARAGLDVAGGLISTDLADRRNLFMVNPLEGNYYATLRTLVSAYQMILPGERARSHRHSPNALRLILDVADNVYTTVDGVRIDMEPGDVVLTPGMTYHGHGNEGAKPGYWIDFLDVPLVHQLEPMEFEHWPGGYQEIERTTRDSPYVFTLASTAAALELAKPDEFGRVRHLLDTPSMPTTAIQMQSLEPGSEPPAMRTTSNEIVAIVSGSGSTTVGDAVFTWKQGDCIAIPSWNAFKHNATTETVMLSVSDEATLGKLGLLRAKAE
jgi:gentisate 1,2-dioxygenase